MRERCFTGLRDDRANTDDWPAIPIHPDQTVSLRQGRLCGAVDALHHALQFARRRLQPGPGCRQPWRAGARPSHRRHRDRRDQYQGQVRRIDPPYSRQWRRGPRRCRRRTVERISARDGYRAAFSRRRHSGHDRRIPRFGLPGDASRTSGRHQRGAEARRFHLRGRSRGAHGYGNPRCRRAEASADLQPYDRGTAVHRRGACAAVPAARLRGPHGR